MLTLYIKDGCPFCAAALHVVDEHEIQIEEKNIADDAVAAELVERGGKRQVPYLIDSERNVEMYESADIAAYLIEHYGKKEAEESSADDAEKTAPGVCPA